MCKLHDIDIRFWILIKFQQRIAWVGKTQTLGVNILILGAKGYFLYYSGLKFSIHLFLIFILENRPTHILVILGLVLNIFRELRDVGEGKRYTSAGLPALIL